MLATQAEIIRHLGMCLMFREVQTENINVGMINVECVWWWSEDFGEVRGRKE